MITLALFGVLFAVVYFNMDFFINIFVAIFLTYIVFTSLFVMYALFNIFAPSFSIKESYNRAKLATSKLFSRFKKDKVVVA